MENNLFEEGGIAYIELYVPMVKPLVYWHVKALGFTVIAYAGAETGKPGLCSYVLQSGDIRLVLTSEYPVRDGIISRDFSSFVNASYCGVKRIALHKRSVAESFFSSVESGAIVIRFPTVMDDDSGFVEEAAIKLYDNCEIVLTNRENYRGVFKPGYRAVAAQGNGHPPLFTSVDHIASELRINEADYWTNYLSATIGSRLVQKIGRSQDNKTGMILNISQTPGNEVTFVMTEPESRQPTSRVQQSVDKFGPGIHHVAFVTDDIVGTIKKLGERHVEFVSFPPAYYDMLRKNRELEGVDIDAIEEQGILIDKEEDGFLLQKFVKPMGDRPYFFYEIVQRVNGYSGFALKNIAALRSAEESQITQVAHA